MYLSATLRVSLYHLIVCASTLRDTLTCAVSDIQYLVGGKVILYEVLHCYMSAV